MTPEQEVSNLIDAIKNIRPAVDALHHIVSENADHCDDTEAYALLVLLASAAKELDDYVLERCIVDEDGNAFPIEHRLGMENDQ